MCRLLGLVTSEISSDYLYDIMRAFVLSNMHDPYMAKLTGSKSYSHDDGWGLVATGYVHDQPTSAFYKSVEPVFHESSIKILKLFVKRIINYKPLYLIIHARKASPMEPYGVEYAHPYMRLSENGVAWFMHNGGAYKTAIAEKLGVNPWIRVDSELLGYYLMDNILSCAEGGNDLDSCVVEAYVEARNYVVKGSALNTALLLLFRNKPYLYITHWLREVSEDVKRDYYTIVAYKSQRLIFAGSISIKEYAPTFIANNIVRLDPGIYRLEPGDIVKITDL